MGVLIVNIHPVASIVKFRKITTDYYLQKIEGIKKYVLWL
jgi:hypothetical protein